MTLGLTKNLKLQKKIIILDSDYKYSLQIAKAAMKHQIQVVITSNLSAFMLEVTKNEEQLISLIVNNQYISDMFERSLFGVVNNYPFIIVDSNPLTQNTINTIPVSQLSFVNKKLGIPVLMKKILSENILPKDQQGFANVSQM